MIIPIRCMNCGNILADKWLFYQQEVKRLRGTTEVKTVYMDGKEILDSAENKAITVENRVLTALGLRRYCCRKHMLTHVDLIDKI